MNVFRELRFETSYAACLHLLQLLLQLPRHWGKGMLCLGLSQLNALG